MTDYLNPHHVYIAAPLDIVQTLRDAGRLEGG